MRVLVVGVGSIGERHVRCFCQTGRAEISICEPDDRLRGEVAERYAIRTAVRGLDEVMSDPPDAAVICTPAQLHVPLALRLADAGVHLLIEKPLSTSLDGVERLKELAAVRGLTVAVAYVQRMQPVLRAMREAVQSGRFGQPLELIAVSGQHFPHYRPAYREIYYRDRATGGGAVQDALTHAMNAGQWLVGPVTELAADCAHLALAGVEVEDTVHVIARHGSLLASYSLNQHQAANEFTLTVVCRHGAARLELHRQRWRWITEPETPWHDESFPAVERDAVFVRQADMFLDAVAHGSPVACSLDEAEHALRVNRAILQAAETRTWQHVEAPRDGAPGKA